MPVIRSLMAARVPDNAQEERQDALSSLVGLTMIAAPLLMTQLFRTFTAEDAPIQLPGAPYFAAALLMISAALVISQYARNHT